MGWEMGGGSPPPFRQTHNRPSTADTYDQASAQSHAGSALESQALKSLSELFT